MPREPLPKFYRVAILFSLTVNVILVLVLVAMPFILRPILSQVMAELKNLENAVIETTVQVDQPMAVQGVAIEVTDPLTVRTTAESQISNAYVVMYLGNSSQVAGSTDIQMPVGTELPIDFKSNIMMSTTIPVRLAIPVQIFLKDTPLAGSFAHFEGMLAPLARLLGIKW